MKKLLLCGVAALVLASCGKQDKTEEINAALSQMALDESGAGRTAYSQKAISGDEVVFKDVVISPADTEEDEPVNADELIFKGLHLNDAGESVFDVMTLKNLKIEAPDEDGVGSVGAISLGGPTPELAAWVSGLLGKGEATEPPAVDKIAFETFSIANLAFSSEEEGGHIGLGAFSVEDYTDYKAGKINLSDMNFEFTDPDSGESGKFTLGGMSFTGLNLKFIQAFDEGDEEAITKKFSEIMYEDPLDPGFDSFSLSKMNFDMGGVGFDLPSMSYDVKRDKAGVPVKYTVPEFTMTITADEEGELGMQMSPMLSMLGFDDIKVSMAGESTYDPKTDISEGKKGYIDIKDAFRLSSTSKIGGMSKMADSMKDMDPEAFAMGEQDPTQMMLEMYSKLEFHNISISLEDKGIVDKAFALAAAERGVDPAQLKQQVTAMVSGLPIIAGGSGIDMEILTELSTATSKFLRDGGTLTVSFDPKEPIMLPSLMADPTAITKESLGFTAVTK